MRTMKAMAPRAAKRRATPTAVPAITAGVAPEAPGEGDGDGVAGGDCDWSAPALPPTTVPGVGVVVEVVGTTWMLLAVDEAEDDAVEEGGADVLVEGGVVWKGSAFWFASMMQTASRPATALLHE